MNIWNKNKQKESEALIDSIPLAFARFQIIYDPHDNPVNLMFLNVNNQFESTLGSKREEVIGKQLTDAFPELKSTLPLRFKLNETSFKNFGKFEYEAYVAKRNQWFDVYVDVQDKYNLTLLFAECTKRKTIEEELKKSELKYKSLYDNSPLGLYRISAEGQIITANKALLEILGFSSFNELLSYNHNVSKLKNTEGGLLDLIKGNCKMIGTEISLKSNNGQSIFIKMSSIPTLDDNGNVLFFERTVEDITEQKIAGQQIANLNHLFLELGVDPEKNIRTIVQKTCNIIGGVCSLYNRLDIKEKSLITWADYNAPIDYVAEDTPEGHICYEATIKAKSKPVVFEDLSKTIFAKSDPNVVKYGLQSYLGMSIVVDDRIIGSLCVVDKVPRKFTDTEINIINTLAKALSLEQKRYFTEDNLKNAISEATNANQVKTQFLANMSHEIRTPLNAIIGFSEMLASQEDDERKERILNMIENSGYQLLKIVNDIFEYTRIDAGNIVLNSESFNLEQVIMETVDFFDLSVKEKGLQLIVNFDKLTENNLLGDIHKLKQILFNVISNAIKFTDEGSIMVIIDSTRNGNLADVHIMIEDTGIGIIANHLNSVFDEFKQLEYYLTKRIKGTGLGLSITKKLVDLLDGTINVESEQGRGSRFSISIPFKIAVNPEDKSKKGGDMNKSELKSDAIPKKVKILLAEDNEANQFLIKAITKSQDWDITVVDNGALAVEKYKTDQFNIILMDVQMPVMNGYEATKIIRQIDLDKGIYTPIIALTAYAMKSDKDICIESGMDDYISKPFKRQQFLEVISNVLQRFNKTQVESEAV
jgi:PAS domain S-box-containing protein